MPRVLIAMEDRVLIATGTDGAWTAFETLTDSRPECLALPPASQEPILCGTFTAGLQRSTDAGRSWSRVGEPSLPDAVMALATDPHDSAVVWAGTEPSSLYRSPDAGRTWTHRPGLTALPSADEWYFPPRPDTHHVRWIEPDPAVPDRLYIGIEAGALVITPDAGESWIERPPGSRRDNHSLAAHPQTPGRIYAAAGDGYAESHDGGETWTHPQTGLHHRYCWSVVPAPSDPTILLLSSARGPRAAHTAKTAESYVYRRTSDEWERVTELPTGAGVTRTVFATEPTAGVIYAANNQGLFRTPNSGESWTQIEIPWPAAVETQTVRALAVTTSA